MPAHGAGEAMDALASNGMRPAIRSMADPIERCFYPGREGPFSGPDGVFERQRTGCAYHRMMTRSASTPPMT